MCRGDLGRLEVESGTNRRREEIDKWAEYQESRLQNQCVSENEDEQGHSG